MTKTRKPYFNRAVSLLLILVMMISIVPLAEISVDAKTSSDFSTSEDGISLICSLEGFHSKCYSDYAQSSIGYGTKCSGSSAQPHKSGLHSITKAKAMEALKSELKTAESNVRKQTKGIQMNQKQFDALVSFCYNTGGGSNYISNSPLVKFLNGKLSENEARSKYAEYFIKAGGKVLQGLINRRKKEADYFFGGSNSTASNSTSSQADDIVSVALGEKQGYYGDNNKFTHQFGALSGYPENGFKYWWCAAFVWCCAYNAGISNKIIPHDPGCSTMGEFYRKQGLLYSPKNYTPVKGDIVFFTKGSGYCHVGIVLDYDKNRKDSLKTVEGNTGYGKYKASCVAVKWRDPNYSKFKVAAYAHPKYKGSKSITVTANEPTNITNKSVQFNVHLNKEADIKKVGVFYGKESAIKKIDLSTEHIRVEGKYEYYLLEENVGYRQDYSFNTLNKLTKSEYRIDLKPSTTYYYKYVVKLSDGWHITNTYYWFTTQGKAPAKVTNLSISSDQKEIGHGDTVTATWKAVDQADYYTVNVYNGENVNVAPQRIDGQYNTSYTTPVFGTADTYRISVKAGNSSGESEAVEVSFTLMDNVDYTFKTGTGDPIEYSVKYKGDVTSPVAPVRTGYTFKGWQREALDENGNNNGEIIGASAKITNVKSDETYNAVWKANSYEIKIVDGISNKTIKSTKADFDSTFDVGSFVSESSIVIPEHKDYEFIGFSEDTYIVNVPESHTIYARYKWDSIYNITTSIVNIEAAQSSLYNKSFDGYSIDVKVHNPGTDAIENQGTDLTVKGRVVVALKTDAGRLLIETESAAFVLYPERTPTDRIINVFVPYESGMDGLPTVVEAYVVNNYYSAGIISSIASTATEEAARNMLSIANTGQWQYTTEPVEVDKDLSNGQKVQYVDESRDYVLYDLTTTTTKESTANSISGFTKTSDSRWSNALWSGTDNDYVINWPVLGNSDYCQFDNTSGDGLSLYTTYNNNPTKATENDGMRVVITEQPHVKGYIYYHWCRNNTNPKTKERAVKTEKRKSEAGYYYNTFHAFYSDWDIGTRDYLGTTYYYQDYDAVCKDSYHWASRIPVYTQKWETQVKVYTYEKKDVQRGLRVDNESLIDTSPRPDDPTDSEESYNGTDRKIPVRCRVDREATNIVHYYAYKPYNVSITHEDKNIIFESNGTVDETFTASLGADYANQNAVVYIYKSTQMSDFTTEYIGTIALDENGAFALSNIQTREPISEETGDFTVAVALAGETNAYVVGKAEAPKPKYDVVFRCATGENEDGTIVYTVLSEQKVEEGDSAELPDSSLVPEKEGYHFIGWNESADSIRKNTVIEPLYEKNVYAVAYVDWDTKNVEIRKFNYGDALTLPDLPKVADDVTVEWVIGNETDDNPQSAEEYRLNGGTVTEDMVISAKYETKQLNVTIIDGTQVDDPSKILIPIEDNDNIDNVLDDLPSNSQTIKYGDVIQLDEIENDYGVDIIFMGWKNAATKDYITTAEITEDMVIYPVYEFADTVETPVASVTTGEYDTAQTITLSCETENADIYYSTDGTNPAIGEVNDNPDDPSGVHKYTGPITLTKTTKEFLFCAMAFGMNNSGIVCERYAINTATSGTKYHYVMIDANIGQYEGVYYEEIIKHNTKLDISELTNITGYTFNGLFYDEEYTDEFYADSQVITEQTTLYASYTPKEYTVTFYDEDGTTVLSTVTAEYMSSAEAPEPNKEGYVFIGWNSDDYLCVTDDGEYTAKYCPEDEYARVSLNLNRDISISVGSGYPLGKKVVITPAELSGTEISFDSSDYNIATVDENGWITGVNAGQCTITVTVESTGESASCTVNVSANDELVLTLNDGSYLDFDSMRYLRRIKKGSNTVGEIRNQFSSESLSFFGIDDSILTESDLVGTGTIIKLTYDGEVVDQATAIMTGDFDGNGKVQPKDVSMMAQLALNTREASEIQMLAVDANGDGYVNVRDCAMISRYIVGKENLQ